MDSRAPQKKPGGESRAGYEHVPSTVDDHSRLAYAKILPDIKAETCVGFWKTAQALADWIHNYNHHRGHTAIGGPPISRVNNQGGCND